MGVQATGEDFITSSQATAYYLKNYYPCKTLYVCGTRSLLAELAMEHAGYDKEETAAVGECGEILAALSEE